MRINPDIINSISDNKIDISSAWAWVDVLTYSPRYTETFNQPISVESTTMDFFRFKEPICTITIRETPDPNSTLLWTGISYNIEDDGNATNGTSTPDTINYSTGVVGNIAPSATYGSGTITIADTYVNLCSDAFFETPIKTYWVNGGTFTLIDGTEQYLVIDYNNGTPIYRIENNKIIVNKSSIILVRICWRQGNNVHSIDSDCQGLGLANKIESAIINTTPYRKSTDGGMILSETATPTNRTVLITGAVVYSGSTPHQILAFNSSINQFTFVRHVAGVWTYSDVSVYNNSQYDNGTDLVSLTTNKYTVNWIYRSIGNSIQSFFVLGNNEYSTVAHAQASTAINVPFLLRDHCMLVGRIIVQKGATSGVVENVADTTFTGATVTTNHNDLAGLQGNGPEYYHFTGAQYTDLTDGLDSSLHYHSTDRNRANHTGTQLASTISDFDNSVKTYGDSKYPQLSIQYTNPTWLAGIDASTVKSGTFDLARIPALPSANTVVCSTIPAMSAPDQALVGKGTVVIESSTGNTYRYSGSGSVILNASYIQQSDLTPDWATITNRPVNISTWTNDSGYLTSSTGDARYSLLAHTHTFASLTGIPFNFGTHPTDVSAEGFWSNSVTKGSDNFSVLWAKNNNWTMLNAINALYLELTVAGVRSEKLTITPTLATFANDVVISGLTASKLIATDASKKLYSYTLNNGDITTALGYTPINKAGDTGIGALTLTGVLNVNNNSGINTSGTDWQGVGVTTTASNRAAFIYFITPSNTNAYWSVQKRDTNDGVSSGSFCIEDSNATAATSQRFPIAIAAGNTGAITFNRPVTGTTATFSGLVKTNYRFQSLLNSTTVAGVMGNWAADESWGIIGKRSGLIGTANVGYLHLCQVLTSDGTTQRNAGLMCAGGYLTSYWDTTTTLNQTYNAIYPTGVSTGPTNYAFLCQTNGGTTYLNASNYLRLRIGNAEKLVIENTVATFSVPLSGTTASFTGNVSTATRFLIGTDAGFGLHGDGHNLYIPITSQSNTTTGLIAPTSTTANNPIIGRADYRWYGMYAGIGDFNSLAVSGNGVFGGTIKSLVAGIDVNNWAGGGYATFGCSNAITTDKVCLMQNNTTFGTVLNGLTVVNISIAGTNKIAMTASETNIQNDLTFYPGQGRLACGNAVTEEHSGDGGSSLASAKILTLNKCCVITPAPSSVYWYIPSATIIGQRIDLILKGTGGGPVGARVYANTSGSAIISHNGANVAFVGVSTVSTYISLIWDGNYWVSCK